METRALGGSGLEIAPLVFGGNVLGWTIDEPASFAVLDAFVDHGFNAIDTADVYSAWKPGNSGGESETIIGNWLAANSGKRDKVVLFTKVGSRMPRRRGRSRCAGCGPIGLTCISRTARMRTRRMRRRWAPTTH